MARQRTVASWPSARRAAFAYSASRPAEGSARVRDPWNPESLKAWNL